MSDIAFVYNLVIVWCFAYRALAQAKKRAIDLIHSGVAEGATLLLDGTKVSVCVVRCMYNMKPYICSSAYMLVMSECVCAVRRAAIESYIVYLAVRILYPHPLPLRHAPTEHRVSARQFPGPYHPDQCSAAHEVLH